MSTTILEHIEQQLPQLSRAEAQVGHWVKEYAHDAVKISIADMAAAIQVSEPTIIRFCRSMGLGGFRELKMQLAVALQQPKSYLHQDVDPGDSAELAAQKVLDNTIRALVKLRETTSAMPFEQAVTVLTQARQLIFVGLGASGHVARDAWHKFFRLGIPCTTALDAQTVLQSAAIAQSDDVYIAISHAGGWTELVDGMRLARDNGATIIALTAPDAPLAATADILFECHPPEDTSVYTPMSSRLLHLSLLDALQVTLALKLGDHAAHNLKRSKQVLKQALHRIQST